MLHVSVLSREEVLALSSGVIDDAAELRSERVFGPHPGFSCTCGHTRDIARAGGRCARCGERIELDPRLDRFGHVELAAPVAHPFVPSATIDALLVLPPGLRDRALDRDYARVLRANRAAREEAGHAALARAVRRLFAALRRRHRARSSRPRTLDFSAAGPIVADPTLAWSQCGLPRHVHAMLAKPTHVVLVRDEVESLEHVLGLACVPVEGDAIRVHPAHLEGLGHHVRVLAVHGAQACSAVARMEVPSPEPRRDALLGLAWATRVAPEETVVRAFVSLERVEEAWARGELGIDDTIAVRVGAERVRTTVGRALIEHHAPGLRITRPVDRRFLRSVPEHADALWSLGLAIATREGLSIGMDDLAAPPSKPEIVRDGLAQAALVEHTHAESLITDAERYARIVDIWCYVRERVARAEREERGARRDDVLRVMADAGAGIAHDELARVSAMIGCVSNRHGEIHELPVTGSHAEGLAPLELFLVARSARAATMTADARRAHAARLRAVLLRAVGAVTIVEDDCGTTEGRVVRALADSGVVLRTVGAGAAGLVLLEDVHDPRTGVVIAARGSIVDRAAAVRIDEAHVTRVVVRWPADCAALDGVCRACAGTSAIDVGARAAFALASSLHELRDRTWGRVPAAWLQAGDACRVEWRGVEADETEDGWRVIAPGGRIALIDERGEVTEHAVHPGDLLLGADGARVEPGTAVVHRNPWVRAVLAALPHGVTAIVSLERAPCAMGIDEITGLEWRQVRDVGARPVLVLRPLESSATWAPLEIDVPVGASLRVDDGQRVERGDLLAMVPVHRARVWERTTSGIALLEELLNAETTGDEAALAPIEGVVRVVSDDVVRIEPPEGAPVDVPLAHARDRVVQDRQWVARGEPLSRGTPSHHALLRIMGARWIAAHLADEVAELYARSGLSAATRDLGLVVRAMLSRPPALTGLSTLLRGPRARRMIAALERADHIMS